MLKTSQKTQAAVTRRTKVSRLAARKTHSPRTPCLGEVEWILLAAISRSLPDTLLLVASADDQTFEKITRRMARLILGRDDLADVSRRAGITLSAEEIKGAKITLACAVGIRLRLQGKGPA